MKRLLLTMAIALVSIISYAQNYNDLFTTYKSVPTQQTRKQRQTANQGTNGYYNGTTQYEVMDANKFFQSVAPQNTQTVNAVFVRSGQFYSVKIKVGTSGTNQNQMVVCGYWDGQIWNNITAYASPLSYGTPEQIKRACTHQAYIASLGTIYF